jgi:hypothetical protein
VSFNINVVATNHHRIVEFAEATDSTEQDIGATIIAFVHLAVISLNVECDEAGSSIQVFVNGNKLRTIAGGDLAELGNRVRRSSTEVIGSWWNETSSGIHPMPRGQR